MPGSGGGSRQGEAGRKASGRRESSRAWAPPPRPPPWSAPASRGCLSCASPPLHPPAPPPLQGLPAALCRTPGAELRGAAAASGEGPARRPEALRQPAGPLPLGFSPRPPALGENEPRGPRAHGPGQAGDLDSGRGGQGPEARGRCSPAAQSWAVLFSPWRCAESKRSKMSTRTPLPTVNERDTENVSALRCRVADPQGGSRGTQPRCSGQGSRRSPVPARACGLRAVFTVC